MVKNIYKINIFSESRDASVGLCTCLLVLHKQFFILHVYLSSWNYKQSRKACSVQLICVIYTLFGLDTFIGCGTWQQFVEWNVGWHLLYDLIVWALSAVKNPLFQPALSNFYYTLSNVIRAVYRKFTV